MIAHRRLWITFNRKRRNANEETAVVVFERKRVKFFGNRDLVRLLKSPIPDFAGAGASYVGPNDGERFINALRNFWDGREGLTASPLQEADDAYSLNRWLSSVEPHKDS